MSDNDLIKRGEVKTFRRSFVWCGYLVSGVTIEDIDCVPAVPTEMTAMEYEKAFQRITYEDVETYRAWLEAIHDEDWGRAVAIVEAWAKEHPEERSE